MLGPFCISLLGTPGVYFRLYMLWRAQGILTPRACENWLECMNQGPHSQMTPLVTMENLPDLPTQSLGRGGKNCTPSRLWNVQSLACRVKYKALIWLLFHLTGSSLASQLHEGNGNTKYLVTESQNSERRFSVNSNTSVVQWRGLMAWAQHWEPGSAEFWLSFWHQLPRQPWAHHLPSLQLHLLNGQWFWELLQGLMVFSFNTLCRVLCESYKFIAYAICSLKSKQDLKIQPDRQARLQNQRLKI